MLTLSVGHDVGYYLRSGSTGGVGYYNRGDEPPGVWAGAGAARMGLSGNVDPSQMVALYHKLIAPTGEKLYGSRAPGYVDGKDEARDDAAVQEALAAAGPLLTPGERRAISAKVRASSSQAVPYFDMTLSMTKSPSVLWASYLSAAAKADQEGRKGDAAQFRAKAHAITDALRETAEAMVVQLERHASFVRTGHHSAHTGEWRDAAGFVASIFVQHDNREGEPNLHAHVVILNRAQRADGADAKWRTLFGRALCGSQRRRAGHAALPAAEPARPAGPPRPRPGAEDQPDLALEGGIPGLLAAAVRPARTRLTSHPVPATRKGGRPGPVGAGAAPGTPGSTASPPGTRGPDKTAENRHDTISNQPRATPESLRLTTVACAQECARVRTTVRHRYRAADSLCERSPLLRRRARNRLPPGGPPKQHQRRPTRE
jgi:hypothetical protein